MPVFFVQYFTENEHFVTKTNNATYLAQIIAILKKLIYISYTVGSKGYVYPETIQTEMVNLLLICF